MSSICKNYVGTEGFIGIVEQKKPFTGAFFLTILDPKLGTTIVCNRVYSSRKTAMATMRKYLDNPAEIVFASELCKLSSEKLSKLYSAEIEWLKDLTAYEWQPGLVPFDSTGAIVTLDIWKEEKIDNIPRKFLIPHGYELLMVLWNKFII